MWSLYKKDGHCILKLDDNYYILNEFTYEVLQNYRSGNLLSVIKKYDFEESELEKILEEIDTKIEQGKYFKKDFNTLLKVQWKITNNCNLKCLHCYIGDSTENYCTEKQLFFIAERLVSNNIPEVIISGGEPLLIKCMDKIVNYLLEQGVNVKICTNAVLLPDFLNKVNKSHMNKLKMMISLDGLEKTHNNIRGSSKAFAQTVLGIKLAIEYDVEVTINTVVNKLNYLEIGELLVFTKSLGVRKMQISKLFTLGNAEANSHVLTIDEMEYNSCLAGMEIFSQNNPEVNLSYAKKIDNEYHIYKGTNERETFVGIDDWNCAAGQCKLTIDSNGDILCCPMISQSKLGNIFESSIEDIWNCEKRADFLSLIKRANYDGRNCVVIRNEIDKYFA